MAGGDRVQLGGGRAGGRDVVEHQRDFELGRQQLGAVEGAQAGIGKCAPERGGRRLWPAPLHQGQREPRLRDGSHLARLPEGILGGVDVTQLEPHLTELTEGQRGELRLKEPSSVVAVRASSSASDNAPRSRRISARWTRHTPGKPLIAWRLHHRVAASVH